MGPPFAVTALDHVGDHAMGVELGVEIAGSVVAESGGDNLLWRQLSLISIFYQSPNPG